MTSAAAPAVMREASGRVSSARKVNVLIVTSGLGLGGAETVIRLLAQEIDRTRFNVTICCLKELGVVGRELQRAGVDIVTLPKTSGREVDYLTSLKLRQLIRARQIDVLHTHTAHALVDAGVCKLLSPRLKVIHTFHFGNYPHIGRRIMWMERLFSRVVDRVVAVGEVQRQQLRAVHGFSDRGIDMVWNGVTSVSNVADGSFRARIDAGNRVVIGTIATLIEQKGLRDLIAVADRLREYRDRVRFVIVGEGHLRGELEEMRRQMDLEETVVLAGWVSDAAHVALPAFDVFFQPSLWEAMSVAVLEAMSARKAIVATRVGETPHVLRDGVDGLLVNPRDIDGMATALRSVIDDSDLRQRLGRSAGERAAWEFTVARMCRSYEQIYLDVVR
jgi:glycosyltransferase involved in cell wall biosynthesis